MPLRIKIPNKDRIIINGAVIENSGDATTLVVHNKADILRRKEVMQESEANSPSKRIYYSLQGAYLFESEREEFISKAKEFLAQYLEAAKSAESTVQEILELIDKQEFYAALTKSRSLIKHEEVRISTILAKERPKKT